jgi:hypothetical protein
LFEAGFRLIAGTDEPSNDGYDDEADAGATAQAGQEASVVFCFVFNVCQPVLKINPWFVESKILPHVTCDVLALVLLSDE